MLQGSEPHLEAVLDALGEAVTIRGPDDHLIYANRAALDVLGFASVEDLRNADPRLLMGDYETTGEHGQGIDMDDLPSVRLLRGEQPTPLLLRSVNRATGEEQWALLKTNCRARQRRLDRVGGDDHRERDREQARGSAPGIPSRDDQPGARLLARLSGDASQRGGVGRPSDRRLVRRRPVRRGRRSASPWRWPTPIPARSRWPSVYARSNPRSLIQTRASEGSGGPASHSSSRRFPTSSLVAAAVDAEHLELLRAVGMRSALIVPMTARGRTIGALTMVSAESGRVFNESDVEFAEQIAEARRPCGGERAPVQRALQDRPHTSDAACCPKRCLRFPAGSSRRSIARRDRATRSAATSTTSGRSMATG